MKRKRSAKQRANDKRLGLMARKRGSRKVKRTTKVVIPMARRRSAKRRSYTTSVRRAVSRKSGSKILSYAKPIASGIGGSILVETIANRVGFGQYGQIAGYGGAYAFGGVKGIVGKLGFDLLSGRGIGLGIGSSTGSQVGSSL
jgi:hypothetical protein